jgi:HD superfamily phosphodiesterase
MCHDVAKLDEAEVGKPHEELGAAFAGHVLHNHLPPAETESIQAAILKEDDSTLGRLLHDADKLDKIGASGIVRRVSVETRPDWLPQGLARVADDQDHFPPMHFPRSEALAASKMEFLAWFLPLAREVGR